jgi:hypothetical protein
MLVNFLFDYFILKGELNLEEAMFLGKNYISVKFVNNIRNIAQVN